MTNKIQLANVEYEKSLFCMSIDFVSVANNVSFCSLRAIENVYEKVS